MEFTFFLTLRLLFCMRQALLLAVIWYDYLKGAKEKKKEVTNEQRANSSISNRLHLHPSCIKYHAIYCLWFNMPSSSFSHHHDHSFGQRGGPMSLPWGPNPNRKAHIPASRFNLKPWGLLPRLKVQIPIPRLKFHPQGKNPRLKSMLYTQSQAWSLNSSLKAQSSALRPKYLPKGTNTSLDPSEHKIGHDVIGSLEPLSLSSLKISFSHVHLLMSIGYQWLSFERFVTILNYLHKIWPNLFDCWQPFPSLYIF